MITEPKVPTPENIGELMTDDAEVRRVLLAVANGAEPNRWWTPMGEYMAGKSEPPTDWSVEQFEVWGIAMGLLSLAMVEQRGTDVAGGRLIALSFLRDLPELTNRWAWAARTTSIVSIALNIPHSDLFRIIGEELEG